MIDVVVAYDRTSAQVLEQITYTNEAKLAFAKRLELELLYRARTDVEVVLLRANRIEDLKLSHARYFAPESINTNELIRYSEEVKRYIA